MQNFSISEEVITSFPNNYTGVIPKILIPEEDLLTIITIEIEKEYSEKEELQSRTARNSEIWQAIFSKMGAKAKYKSSITSLYERFMDKRSLWKINPLVDFYNYVSLHAGVPMAAYDFEKLGNEVELRYAKKGELFTPLGNPKQKEKTKTGEIIYVDESKVICKYWNLKDCDETKITPTTKHATFFFDLIADDLGSAEVKMNNIFKKWFERIDPSCDYTVLGSGSPNSTT